MKVDTRAYTKWLRAAATLSPGRAKESAPRPPFKLLNPHTSGVIADLTLMNLVTNCCGLLSFASLGRVSEGHSQSRNTPNMSLLQEGGC